MKRSFEELRLDPALIERLRQLGYRRPTDFQIDATPVIARGTTAVGVASAGCGKTLAYATGLIAAIDPSDPSLQALVLRPTEDAAGRTAEAIYRLAHPLGIEAGLVTPGGESHGQISVAGTGSALAGIQRSLIKLETLRALVVDGASAMFQLDLAEQLETISAQVPRDTQRVLLTSEMTDEVKNWIDRHARRARRIGYIPLEVEPVKEGAVEFCAAPRHQWFSVLVRALDNPAARTGIAVRVHCRFEAEADQLRERLAVRGVRPGVDGIDIEILSLAEPPAAPLALSISWGSPADLDELRNRLSEARHAITFLEPAELAHLRRMAGALGVRLTAFKAILPAEAHRSVQQTRDELRAAANERDLEPYMLALEALFEDFTPIQIAAAATSLLRDRAPASPSQALPAWTRLYFGVGRRDGVRPADLVGAITGESPVKGDQIGRIEIRDNHTSVEVAAQVADKVIKALSSATIRGRPANVRVFRE